MHLHGNSLCKTLTTVRAKIQFTVPAFFFWLGFFLDYYGLSIISIVFFIPVESLGRVRSSIYRNTDTCKVTGKGGIALKVRFSVVNVAYLLRRGILSFSLFETENVRSAPFVWVPNVLV